MFYHDHLIIGYIQEPQHNRYLFQVVGGEEFLVPQEEFILHWQEYCAYEAARSDQNQERQHRLPVTLIIRRQIALFPINLTSRHRTVLSNNNNLRNGYASAELVSS